MAKYKFNKDWFGGTYVPPTSGMATRRVEFKKGDVVDGTFIHVETQSESDYVLVNSSQGTIRIPFGGRSGSVLERVSGDMADRGTGLRGLVVAPKSFFGLMLFIVSLILLIVVYFIYLTKRKKAQ